MKKIFTLLVAVIVATMAWAGETTFVCADLFATSAASATSGNYTFTTDGGSTAATLNTTSNDLRIYAGGTFKIETKGENITKVVFTLSSKGKQRLSEITASAGTIATQKAGDEVVTWTGSAKSVTFTCGSNATYGSDGANKAGQFDFTQFVITDGGSGSVTPDPDPDPDPDPQGVSIKIFEEQADGTAVTFSNPVTVLGQKGNYLYVKDATGYMLVYGSVGQTYKMGDVIPAGFGGTKTTYSGEPELTNPTNFQASTSSETVYAVPIEIGEVGHYTFGYYAVIKGATVDAENKQVTVGSTSVPYYDRFGVAAPTDGKTYDVYGIIGSYQPKGGDVVYQILPTEFKGEGGSVTPDPQGDMTIAKFNALEDGTSATFDGTVTVLGQKGNYLYVKDATGYMLVYGAVNQTYKMGDIIPAGFSGEKTTYSGEPEMKNPSNFSASSKSESVSAEEVAVSGVNHANFGKYVVVKGASIDGSNIVVGGASAAIYDRFGVAAPTDGKTYDVYGIIGSYQPKGGDVVYQLMPTEYKGEGGSVTPDPEDYTDATIADLVKLTANKAKINLTLTDAVVLYADADNGNRQMFVREGDNAIQFYNTGLALQDYQVLNGTIKVDYEYYKEFPEVKAISGVTSLDEVEVRDLGEDEELYAVEATIADLNNGLYKNDVVNLTDVELTKDGNNYFVVDEDGNKVQLYDKFGFDLLPEEVTEGTVITVMGIFGQYFNGVPELYVMDMEGAGGGEGEYLSDLLYYSEDGQEVTVADDLYVMFADENSREIYVTDNYYEEWDLSEYGMENYIFYPSWVELDFSDNEEGFNAVKDAYAIAGGTITGIIDGVLLNPVIAVTSMPEEADVEEVEEWYIFEYDLADEIVAYSNEIGYAKGYFVGGKFHGVADGSDAPVDYDLSYVGDYTFTEGQQYEFLAVFKIKEEWESADDEEEAPAKVRLNKKHGIKAARVEKARIARAKRKMLVDDPNANSNYVLYPLDLKGDGVEDINTNKTVKSVKYYNMMGVESSKEFNGVNVVVITYTDGTKKAVKVLK